MKRIIDVPGKKLIIFYRIIVVLLLLLVVLLIAGSLYGLLRSRDSGPLFRIGGGGQGSSVRNDNAVPDAFVVSDGTNGYSTFSGIGTLRIQNTGKSQASGNEEPAVIIISISFPYKSDDRSFTEELASNLGKFRSVATNYFTNLPRDSLSRLDEEQAKAEILRQYNALLRLGRIETLYFGDLMIMD